MVEPIKRKTLWSVLRNCLRASLALWTVFVGVVLLWAVARETLTVEQMARVQARSAFEKDAVYRQWVASHGGVYVPVSEKTPPSPYLSDVDERDITTPSGRALTLVNPPYMTRQVHEMALQLHGLRGHITSLDPIRPANAGDEWETKALKALEQGEMEVSSVEELDNARHMRLMRPLITTEACLKCHAEYGNKVGDLRGGISVSVPMAPLQTAAREHIATLALGHGLIWLLGMGAITIGGLHLRRFARLRDWAKEQSGDHYGRDRRGTRQKPR
ncbi:MAG: DUF3365 domain-containing protein [Phycisphaerales bacterium]|nr:MAG: DUF3365 domain-containing protein [Phycisphaerales bacterium]